ncbi:hypothetical protein MKW98_000594 [Papaver atlanticum]|uniref:Uncharacterized protein n=1 Tax=Papaver atlanticum TaxID=357466 RepID=A0AAD4X8S7_9MAGN|nr:hypothetical protein MKW98_000594 [Papaver atlanticum]
MENEQDAGYVGIPMSENTRLILESWWWWLELRQMVEKNETEDVKDLNPLSDLVLTKVEEAEKGLLVDYF